MEKVEQLRENYKEIFALKGPLPVRPCKAIFDRCASVIAILFASPVFLLIFFAYLIDNLFYPDDRGGILASYIASDRGKKFIKYKFRITKMRFINKRLREQYDVAAYPEEFPEKLTRVGKILKKAYLDELPQLFNIVKGDMSFVGTRAIAWEVYQDVLQEGYVHKKVLKAALWSETDVRKGTPDLHNLVLEYDYIKKYMEFSAWRLLLTDFKIMARGIKQNIEAKGY
ncbi:MAG: sugar transferase [Candidatus Omnitrophica bacterium]|nr:sugar transferase [Candidatus Omnitrophota bacterium]